MRHELAHVRPYVFAIQAPQSPFKVFDGHLAPVAHPQRVRERVLEMFEQTRGSHLHRFRRQIGLQNGERIRFLGPHLIQVPAQTEIQTIRGRIFEQHARIDRRAGQFHQENGKARGISGHSGHAFT